MQPALHYVLPFACVVSLAVWASGLEAQQVTAEWVARQAEERETGRDSRAEIRMRLFDRRGRMRERVMTLLTRRGSAGDGDRTLVRFTYPNDIKNTALLVRERVDGEDERFLYLPALGRVRRIAGDEKQESFVGSDLSYEDISERDLSDYTYAFVAEDAFWSAPDGSKHPAWQIESTARDRNADSPRSVSWIRKDNFILVHADLYNSRRERTKVVDVKRIEKVEGIWTALSLSVVNERDDTRTELDTISIDYNVGLTEADFSRRRLEESGR